CIRRPLTAAPTNPARAAPSGSAASIRLMVSDGPPTCSSRIDMAVGTAATSTSDRHRRYQAVARRRSSITASRPNGAATYGPVQRAHTGYCTPAAWKERSGRWWQMTLPAIHTTALTRASAGWPWARGSPTIATAHSIARVKIAAAATRRIDLEAERTEVLLV